MSSQAQFAEVVLMSSPSLAPGRQVSALSQPVPLSWILLLALLVHGPLLLMQLPNDSYDAHLHQFFAAHYAQHWFNPWNERWFTGFSQTTYPPLEQQWIAVFSHVMGLHLAYMLVQFIAILLLPIGIYRYARIWVSERAASYAALASVLLGSLSFLVYQAGQISTTWAAPLYLNALPCFYEWSREGKWRSLVKGVVLICAAAAAHHVTLIFGSVLFALPVLVTAIMDRKRHAGGVVGRALIFGLLALVGVGVVLWPYWVALYQNPIKQMPIPHASRNNYFLEPIWSLNYFFVPWGALILALPFIFIKGLREPRLRPLFVGFWLTMIFAMGGTTPLPRLLLGRAFEVVTFERFTFWANLMALPFIGLLAVQLIDRYGQKAALGLSALAGMTMAMAVAWPIYHPMHDLGFSTAEVISFLNRDGHDRYRYLTLGFGSKISEVGAYANASSVDGEYNSARLLPEMTQYGSAQLSNSKFYGTNGMESLRQVLKHADQYGLKWIFVRDLYYEPLLAFAGWRKQEIYDHGNVSLWVKDGIPPAHPISFGTRPTAFEGILWGTLPIGGSILALVLVLFWRERRRITEMIRFPTVSDTEPILREAGS
jgi:6-pyruvoyl-tetrahydropterin synthase related domain